MNSIPIILVSLAGSGGPPPDTTAPTLAITMSQYTFAIGDTATITFTFSEEVTGFTVANITAPNGTLSSFTVTANPLIYTATFTPTNGVTDATNVITVDTNWTDLNGNHPASSTTSSNYSVVTTVPTVSIDLSSYSFIPSATATITFTFSESILNFTSDDVTVENGTISSFGVTGNPLVYTAIFTPTDGIVDFVNKITVGTNWTNSVGTPPSGSTYSSNYEIYTVEITPWIPKGTLVSFDKFYYWKVNIADNVDWVQIYIDDGANILVGSNWYNNTEFSLVSPTIYKLNSAIAVPGLENPGNYRWKIQGYVTSTGHTTPWSPIINYTINP